MRITPGTWVSRACALLVAVALGAPAVYSAHATPSTPEIEEQREAVSAAREELEELAALAELRHEEHQQIVEALASTREEVAHTRDQADAAARELARAQESLESRANSIYRSGGVHFVEVFLGMQSFQDLLTRVEWFRRVSESDAALVTSVTSAKKDLEAAQHALERREAEQLSLRRQAEAKAAEVDTALSRQRRFVEDLDAEITRLVAEEEERLRREAEERARAAEEAARRAAEAAAASRSSGGGELRSAHPNARTFDPGALGSGNPQAVTVGMGYLGVPYVWGGSTPAGFDCSGLTQYVYREIGISIPRNSRAQFTVGAYIPPDRVDLLLPGDLVFFGYGGDPGRVHHVGIYVGEGDYLHAPMTGQDVRVDSLTGRIDRRGDYVGATRP